jgi:hypothetical protein
MEIAFEPLVQENGRPLHVMYASIHPMRWIAVLASLAFHAAEEQTALRTERNAEGGEPEACLRR